MRALVTGGAGFIGQHLVRHLLKRGDDVVILDNLASGGTPHPSASFIHGDVSSLSPYSDIGDVDVVYHLAASFANQRSVDRPAEDAKWNIVGTILAADHAKKCGAKFIYTGSSSSYGEPRLTSEGAVEPFTENDKVSPHTPYALSKFVGEQYARMIIHDAIVLRLFNVFGPGDEPGVYRNAIPNMWSQAQDGHVKVFGADSTRDFTPVEVVVPVIAEGPFRINGGGVFNLCSGVEQSILDIATTIAQRYGTTVETVPRRAWDHVSRRVGDNTLISRYFDLSMAAKMFGPSLNRTLDWLDRRKR